MATVSELFDTIGRLRPGGRGDLLETTLEFWSPADWREVFLNLPTDGDTLLAQFETSWDVSISVLEQWCVRFKDRDEVQQRGQQLFGFVGALVLTMISLRHSERRRSPRSGAEEQPPSVLDHASCSDTCRRFVREGAVQDALRELYAPPAVVPGAARDEELDRITVKEWDGIDFGTLKFHRHGTTSFILTGRIRQRSQGEMKTFALKCIIYPFLRIPRIKRATRDYVTIQNRATCELEHLVRVWASSERWILMDFVPGKTLGERLNTEFFRSRSGADAMYFNRAGFTASGLRIDLIEKFGRELFLALADLEKLGIQHSDLTPANIMVTATGDGRETLRLIDLGVNYLYLNSTLGRDGIDSAYIAPEVRAIGERADAAGLGAVLAPPTEEQPKVDLYSLGQLLVHLGCGRADPHGRVPDIFYAEAPFVARFIEDLLDCESQRRLLIFGTKDGDSGWLYSRLWGHLADEIEAVKAAQSEEVTTNGARWWSDFADLLQPLSGALSRRLRFWRVRREQNLYRDPDRNMRVRWLLFWSTLSAVTWTITSAVVIMWTLRNTGWDWGNQIIVFLQWVSGASPDEFPVLDQLRATDYEIPPGVTPLGLGLLGLSFTLVGVKYYQSLFADITPMVIGWRAGSLTRHALAMELGMRIWTFFPLLMILTPFLFQPKWWLFSAALGMTLVTVSNWLASFFCRVVIARAREAGLSTVPEDVPGISTFSSWIPGNILWAASQWIVAILLYSGIAQDAMVYVVVVGAVNVLQLYGINCGIQGPGVRAGLGRACVTAERLKYVLR